MNKFKNIAALTVVGLALTVTAPLAHATDEDELVVVVNAHNPTQSLSKGEVKSLYLGNTAFWNGVVPVALVVRNDGSDATDAFYEVVGMSSQRYDSHWSAKQLSGQGVAPAKATNASQVASLVQSQPGAIGFMLASEAWDIDNDGIRVLEIK